MENSRTLGCKILMNKTTWLLFLSRLCWILFICWMVLSHCRCTNQPYDSAPNCPSYAPMQRLAELYGMSPLYDVQPTEITPSGILVDPSGQTIDLVAIDQLVDAIDKCLYEQFGQGDQLVWPSDARRTGWCQRASVPFPANRDCVTIKIPNDWITSACSGEQLLPWRLPNNDTCIAKGQVSSEQCPCSWRGGMQDGHTIVTVPRFTVFAQWYIMVFYGCLEPYNVEKVAKCAVLQLN